MNDTSFLFLKIILSICVSLVTVYLIPYLHTLKSDTKYSTLVSIVETAVRAAEQTIKGDGKGAEKKQQVTEFVSRWLADHGINISAEQISELIEAAVFNMHLEEQAK